jgi:hypothetical protein
LLCKIPTIHGPIINKDERITGGDNAALGVDVRKVKLGATDVRNRLRLRRIEAQGDRKHKRKQYRRMFHIAYSSSLLQNKNAPALWL